MPVILVPLHFDRDSTTPSCHHSIVVRTFITNDFMTGIPAQPGKHLPEEVSLILQLILELNLQTFMVTLSFWSLFYWRRKYYVRWLMQNLFRQSFTTVKPRPEAHMDMILLKCFWRASTWFHHNRYYNVTIYIIDNVIVLSDLVESSGYSSKTLQKGSCSYAPLDEALW